MPEPIPHPAAIERRHWRVRGIVQGVGFRPFVFRTAAACGLTGRVWNDPHGVVMEGQGTPNALARFVERVYADTPPLARIDHIDEQKIAPVGGEHAFVIEQSHDGHGMSLDAQVSIDSAVCNDCLAEMRSPENHRHGHPLINCTNCGPRFSIIRGVPYDRVNTTMSDFPMCPTCASEYRDPANRRFHAQPVCCPNCGPRLELVRWDRNPRQVSEAQAIGQAAEMLLAGKIVGLKGLGGFHLAVRADSDKAVERLRQLKKRDAKPFAIMCPNLAAAEKLVTLTPSGRHALAGPAAPIVLARRHTDVNIAAAVAPDTHLLGVMLPYTPIHHLLWDALTDLGANVPALVMTSGNVSSEPLVIDNAEARERLAGLCDALLLHDRPIERPVDDSVVVDVVSSAGKQSRRMPAIIPIRRSRGFVPGVLALPQELAEVPHATGICLGGELKGTVAVVRQRDVIVSQHLGDLNHPLAFAQFEKSVADLVKLFDVRVEFVAHDLHPGYMSTIAAKKLARELAVPRLEVQHHHAHAAAVMAEHGIRKKALAIVCDGTGFGPDGTIWGGEVLVVEGAEYRRLGRIKPMRLPGGDAAARDARRSGLSLLAAAYGDGCLETPAAQRLIGNESERHFIGQMIARGVSSPWTSSTGRLFDGVAALLGVCRENEHEAQAAMALEAAASRWGGDASGKQDGRAEAEARMEIRWNARAGLWELETAGLVRWLVDALERGEEVARLALAFHRELARGLVGLAAAARGEEKTDLLLFSGGVFCNGRMVAECAQVAQLRLFRTFFHESYPTTDGGIALGQAEVITNLLLTGPLSSDKRLFDRNISQILSRNLEGIPQPRTGAQRR